MWSKIIRLLYGKDCDLKERMLRAIIMIGGLATLIAIGEILIVMKVDSVLVPFLVAALLAMGGSIIVTFKYRKYDVAAILIGVIIIAMVFPPLFCLSGGVESGASIWLTLGVLYIFMMFSGKKLVLFLGLSAIVYGGTYWIAYAHPEWIVPMETRAIVHIDSIFSVFAVGICAGLIVKSQMKVYEEEHQLNIRQKEELEKSSNSRNVFFANMSHEIRTPINAIIGLNEMILRENQSGATREYAKDIQVASKLLLSQVNDILDLSQMELNKMKIVPIQYNTIELFGELVELIHVQARKKGLEFHLDLDRQLPSVLLGDERRVKQILLNLLDNAVKYTKEGSVILSVYGEEVKDDEINLTINISDTGIGIRKEDLEHIYDSFNRFDERRNKKVVGSGLGLAITKQLVDLMDGEITIDSIYTKGTVFTVTLKQKVVDVKPIGNNSLSERRATEGEVYHPSFEAPEARVLIVDDNAMNSLVAGKLLEATKVQVDIAHSGKECLAMTRKKYYHVILLDYMMPDMDGVETLKAIMEQENGLCRESAVIVLTGNTISEARQMYMEEGFDGYVEKPIQGRLLEAEILKFLPNDIIEYLEEERKEISSISPLQRMNRKKLKKVYITSDCACDIPSEYLEKYDIKVMHLYIKTPYGRFADTREIDSDSLAQYLTAESSTATADSVMIEEYEEFFGEVLTQAEQVIHISLGSRAGASYHKSVEAAKGFGHVKVIDSGQISGGQGLIAIYAAKLAMEGKTVNEICKEIDRVIGRVRTQMIFPGADIFYHNGRTGALTARLCKVLGLHPMLTMRQKNAVMTGVIGGELEHAWKKWLRFHLRSKRKICQEVLFITHVSCNVKQLEWLKEEALKCIPFERVVIQKASLTNACNCGLQSIGISYLTMK